MGKQLGPPQRRTLAPRRPADEPPPEKPAILPLPLRVFSIVETTRLQTILSGYYDIPDLEFAVPPHVLDIGAHVGASTLWLSKRWPGATINAYEPHPASAEALRTNVDGIPNVHVHALAVVGSKWPVDVPLTLYDGRAVARTRSLYQLGEQRMTGVVVDTIQVSTLPPATILRVDTEGCEVEILEEYPHIQQIDAIMVEWKRPDDRKRILQQMPGKGFKLVKDAALRNGRDHLIIYARSPRITAPPKTP